MQQILNDIFHAFCLIYQALATSAKTVKQSYVWKHTRFPYKFLRDHRAGNLRCRAFDHTWKVYAPLGAADRKSNLPSFQMFRNINAGAPHNFIPIAIHHRLSIEIRSQTECARETR